MTDRDLIAAFRDTDSREAEKVARKALRRATPQTWETLTALCMKKTHPGLAILDALRKRSDPEAIALLRRVCREAGATTVRIIALGRLADHGGPESVDAQIAALADPSPDVQVAAASHLLTRLERDRRLGSDPELRRASIALLRAKPRIRELAVGLLARLEPPAWDDLLPLLTSKSDFGPVMSMLEEAGTAAIAPKLEGIAADLHGARRERLLELGRELAGR